jgi:uncharacterized protein YqhQ
MSNKIAEQLAMGGQAVIEGVMMRGPERLAIAVRKKDGGIALKAEPFQSIVKRIRLLNIPIFRGAIILIETLFLGTRALSFSGEVAMSEEEKEKNSHAGDNRWNSLWMAVTIVFALALGIAFFFYLPLLLTELLGIKNGVWFNLVDGVIRLLLFLLYIWGISMWKEIRRVFEYHGAEHKSIYAYENKRELVAESARSYSTLHPRCGTSFLLIVMLVSVVVFMFLGRPATVSERLIRLAFVPVIGGISYELIKLSGKAARIKYMRFLLQPGLWLQKITTSEPDEAQLEVAMVALRSALGQEPVAGPSKIEMVS